MPAVPSLTSDDLLACSQLRELASGVDALYLSGRARLPSGLLERLEVAKDQAKEGERSVVLFGGLEFGVGAGGWGNYRYRLNHPTYGQVGVTPSEALPALRFQPRAELLHSIGPADAVAMFDELATQEVGELRLSVSRVDVFADWQGWELHPEMAQRFVSKSRRRTTYEDGERCTGFAFGFGQGSKRPFSARIYDKTAEIAGNGHDWWFDVWGPRYTPGETVHRVEFQVERQGVRSMQLDTPGEVLDAVGDLWRYCTHKWLSHRTQTDDQTKSRWPIAPEWQDIQRCTLIERQVGLARLKEGGRDGALRLLMPLLNGCVSSFAAHLGTDEIEETVALLPDYLRRYEATSGKPFITRVHEKRRPV